MCLRSEGGPRWLLELVVGLLLVPVLLLLWLLRLLESTVLPAMWLLELVARLLLMLLEPVW